MDEEATLDTRRPQMPGALTALYVIAIVGAAIAVAAVFILGLRPVAVGYLLGAAVGLFIPALVTHAIVAAIYDLRWRGKSSLP